MDILKCDWCPNIAPFEEMNTWAGIEDTYLLCNLCFYGDGLFKTYDKCDWCNAESKLIVRKGWNSSYSLCDTCCLYLDDIKKKEALQKHFVNKKILIETF